MNQPILTDKDPSTTQINEPIQTSRQYHFFPMLSTICFYGFIYFGFYLHSLTQTTGDISSYAFLLLTVLVGYGVYLYLTLKMNKLSEHFSWSTSFKQYQKRYDEMRDAQGFFQFSIDCFHTQNNYYHTTQTDQNGTTWDVTYKYKNAIITHSAKLDLHPSTCVDVNGEIKEPPNDKWFIFLQYVPKYKFSDPDSQIKLQKSYEKFKGQNKRDDYQDANCTFKIKNSQWSKSAVFSRIEGKSPKRIFYLWIILGFGYYYLMYLECFRIKRLSVNIMKKVTIR